jgi:hypothetical protein
MSRESQIRYCESLANQLIALWIKLGGKYADWSDQKVHLLLKEKRIAYRHYDNWREYHEYELQSAIGVLKRILAYYQKKWWTVCSQAASERQQQITFEAELEVSCEKYADVCQWMADHAPNMKLVEHFVYAGNIGAKSYWRRREKVVRLYTEKEARILYDAIVVRQPEFEGRFLDLFEPTAEPGFDGSLFKQRFVYEV